MTGYTQVFGNQPIYEASPALLALALTANTELAWPLEAPPGQPVLATLMDVTPDAAGRVITLPDAREGSLGYAATFANLGADTFTVRDNAGNVVLTVASGLVWTAYLRTNTTAAGTWGVFQQGAGVSTANAASLAGAGLKAITTTLNTQMLYVNKALDYVLVDADRASAITWTGGVGTLTLPDVATVGNGWYVTIRNAGGGSVVVASAGSDTVDGAASVSLAPGDSAFFYSNGVSAFYSVAYSSGTTSAFDNTGINVAGTGVYNLTGAELNRVSYNLTGVLTGNREVVVPATVQEYWVANNTTGAFTLTVKTALGTGIAIPQGGAMILYCDAANVIASTTTAGLADGSSSLPALYFALDPNTGIIRDSADSVSIVAGGVGSWVVRPTIVFPVSTAQLVFRVGSAGAPGLSIFGDLDTGFYQLAGDQIQVSTGGVLRFTFTSTGHTSTVPVYFPDGSLAAPSIAFSTETNTGFFLSAASQIGISLAGVSAGLISQGSFNMTLTGFTAAPTPTVTWQRFGNMVMLRIPQFSSASNGVGFTCTNLPAAIQPSTPTWAWIGSALDNSTPIQDASVGIIGATMTFNRNNAGLWTAANNKGLGVAAFAPSVIVSYMM